MMTLKILFHMDVKWVLGKVTAKRVLGNRSRWRTVTRVKRDDFLERRLARDFSEYPHFTSMWKRIFRVIICGFTALHSWVGRRGKENV